MASNDVLSTDKSRLGAGIRPGDIIVSVNGQQIGDIDQLRGIIAKSGKKAAIPIERGYARIFVPVDLG